MATTKKDRTKRVLAAGAVLWRPGDDGDPLIAVIHRPRYDDWSLPKGKLDDGETEPVAAVREILEETGFHARLGRRLGRVNYLIPGAVKMVRFWSARAGDGTFTPSEEADDMRWLPVADARRQLSYPLDRKILGRFLRTPADTRTVLIVRHATAGRRSRYKGDDRKRPLDKKGRAQAESLVPQLLAFGATTIHAADRIRCAQTVEPLARRLEVPVTPEASLTEEAYARDPKAARERLLEIAAGDGVPVICTQGKVIPPLIDWWCGRDGVTPDKSRNRKGSTWVVSLAGDRVLAADHLPSPLSQLS